MIRKCTRFLLVGFFCTLTSYANGQGCSDAGFCTINSFKPDAGDSISRLKNQFKAGISYGSADKSVSIVGSYLEYNKSINDQFGIDAKLTALSQSGNGISEFGFSDIFLNANFKISDKTKLTIGTKIPLTNGNRIKRNSWRPFWIC